jgi:hypothetical protein
MVTLAVASTPPADPGPPRRLQPDRPADPPVAPPARQPARALVFPLLRRNQLRQELWGVSR